MHIVVEEQDRLLVSSYHDRQNIDTRRPYEYLGFEMVTVVVKQGFEPHRPTQITWRCLLGRLESVVVVEGLVFHLGHVP